MEQNWLQRWLLTIGGYYSRESRLLRGAKVLYRGIVEQATHKPLYDGAAVPWCFWYNSCDILCGSAQTGI